MLLNAQSSRNTRVYNSRGNAVMAMWLGDAAEKALLLNFEPEWGGAGYVMLSIDEAVQLSHALASFFEGGKFIYAKAAVHPPTLPQLYMASTNWGEPYDEGLSFVLCDNFKSNDAPRLSFSLVAHDIKDLNNWLQSQLQQKQG